MLMALLPAFAVGAADFLTLTLALGPAFVGGMFGVMMGWLAWYGAVEPLPEITIHEVQEAAANVTFPCGICGGVVTQDVKADCVFGCGRVFHAGCYEAKRALGQAHGCAVCGYQPA